MGTEIRTYDRERDLQAVTRIWQEIGWIDPDSDTDAAALARFMDGSEVEVGILDGEAECAVAWHRSLIRYGYPAAGDGGHDRDDGRSRDLGLAIVAAVTTSRVARRQGFATAMTARSVRAAAEAGMAVAALGIFDQGFYDRLGFGTLHYDHRISFDPGTLLVDDVPYRRPVRVTADDTDELHALHTRRARRHGGVVIGPGEVFAAEASFTSKSFGLGIRDGDGDGRLVAYVYGRAAGENGPYTIHQVAYERPDDLLALLRVMKELADQVTWVSMVEPPEIQLQDLLDQPFRHRRISHGSEHEFNARAMAFVQLRIVDLAATVSAHRWPGPPVRCNLRLTDPVTGALERADRATGTDGAGRWNGVGGDHVLTVGSPSVAEPGHDPDLPTLTASVGAFSRMWFGVRPASDLTITDDLAGPPELLAALDRALALPAPSPGWGF